MERETEYELFPCNTIEKGSPLDYSFDEACKKWNADIPVQARKSSFRWECVADCTKKSVLFSKVFPQKDHVSGSPKSKRDFTPILVETEAFFRDYILTIMNSPRPDMQNMRNPENRTLPENFGVDFFKNARNSIRNSPDSLAYYEKALYSDPTFQSYAAKYYWEAEFDRRCRMLKNTVLKCPPDLRLSGMSDILAFLDAKIGVFASLAHRYQEKPESQRSSASSQKASQKFTERMPLSLCSLRKKGRVKKGRLSRPAYFFNDIPVAIDQADPLLLSDIFKTLKPNFSPKEKRTDKTRRNQLREAARKAYLLSLSNKVPECDFLIQARELDNYLQTSSVQYALDDVIPLIKEIARQYYSHLLNNTDYQLFSLQDIPENATTAFLCGIIGSFAGLYLNNNQMELSNLQEPLSRISSNPIPRDATDPEYHYQMESPQLFCDIFGKFIGRDFFDCITPDPQRTYLENMLYYYYTYLYQLEYPTQSDSNDETVCEYKNKFTKSHISYDKLCFAVHDTWNSTIMLNYNGLEQYLDGSDDVPPFWDSALYSVFTVVKLYADYRHTIEITENCYKQYQIEEQKFFENSAKGKN